MRHSSAVWVLLFASWSFPACPQDRPSQPEAATGFAAKTAVHAKRYVVAAAHPLAVNAGLQMLDRGGSAVDAMIATQLVLHLVEPGSSGLGGGGYLLHYDAASGKLAAYDARETAPSGATPSLFIAANGKPMTFPMARIGGRAVGVPSIPRLLEVAHARHGKLPWKDLFEPAILLAETGFPMSPRVHKLVSQERGLSSSAQVREVYFTAAGAAKPVGAVLKSPGYAATLRAIAAQGADAFYQGEIARDFVAAVRTHRNPGAMTEEDLTAYRVRDEEPICGAYRRWKLCGMPPSSSGGIAVLQVLGMLERFNMGAVRPGSSQAVHLISEAERLAFADRGRYVADARFVDVPVSGLIDKAYISKRSELIAAEKSLGRATAGVPEGVKVAHADDAQLEAEGTSHMSIVDAAGNAVSFTTSVESYFGSHIMVHGVTLNNVLTDFDFVPVEEGRPVANGVVPGKRPRSSMSPFMVFGENGRLEMVVGSPGGSLIIGYVVKALVAMLDWNMNAQEAIDLPNFGSRNGPTEVEKGTELERVQAALRSMGHDVRAIDMTSGLHAIRRDADGWQGGADPRREGVARGK